MYTQLSLNMLNYWNSTDLAIINSQLQNSFQQALQLMNDTSLNFTTYRPFFSAKYHEMKLVQSYVLANNTQMLSQLSSSIGQTLAQLENLQQFLYNQTMHYRQEAKKVSQGMSYHLNTSIILTIIYIILFWIIGIKLTYSKILDEHLLIF